MAVVVALAVFQTGRANVVDPVAADLDFVRLLLLGATPTSSAKRSSSRCRGGRARCKSSDSSSTTASRTGKGASTTESIAVSYEATVKATAGVAMAGFSVGNETRASLGVTAGTTTFGGSVGDILPDEFSLDNAYGYGMFAYTAADDEGRAFEVIDYWVE